MEKIDGQKTSLKKIALKILRVALALAPIVWIYARTDAGAFGEALAATNVPLFALITAQLFVCMVLQGVKWWTLIRCFVPELKLSKAVSVHLESVFYSIVLPSNAQDIVKSVMLSKTHSPSVVWSASWLARLMGLFSLLIFSVLGLICLKSDILPPGFRVSLVTAIIAIAILSALSFSKRLTRPIRAIAAKKLSPKIMDKIEKLREGIYSFKNERKTLAQTFAVSTVTQLLLIFTSSLVIYAVSGRFHFIECLMFVPLVEIMVVSLPLTPGGLGIREAMMALMFTRLGFSEEQIAMFVTISLICSIIVKLSGGLPILLRMIVKRK